MGDLFFCGHQEVNSLHLPSLTANPKMQPNPDQLSVSCSDRRRHLINNRAVTWIVLLYGVYGLNILA